MNFIRFQKILWILKIHWKKNYNTLSSQYSQHILFYLFILYKKDRERREIERGGRDREERGDRERRENGGER